MNLTIADLKELISTESKSNNSIDKYLLEKVVIIRTYSAGVHFGTLIEKAGKEVILRNSRRLWYWKTKNDGISLSEVAIDGLHKDSRVCAPIPLLWLEAIEIIPCSEKAIENIKQQPEYKA